MHRFSALGTIPTPNIHYWLFIFVFFQIFIDVFFYTYFKVQSVLAVAPSF